MSVFDVWEIGGQFGWMVAGASAHLSLLSLACAFFFCFFAHRLSLVNDEQYRGECVCADVLNLFRSCDLCVWPCVLSVSFKSARVQQSGECASECGEEEERREKRGERERAARDRGCLAVF